MVACYGCGESAHESETVRHRDWIVCYRCIDEMQELKFVRYCIICDKQLPIHRPSGRKRRKDATMCLGGACRNVAYRRRGIFE